MKTKIAMVQNSLFLTSAFLMNRSVLLWSAWPDLKKAEIFFSPFSTSQISNIINQWLVFSTPAFLITGKSVLQVKEKFEKQFKDTAWSVWPTRAQRPCKHLSASDISHVFYVNWPSRRQMESELLFFAQKKHWICLHHCYLMKSSPFLQDIQMDQLQINHTDLGNKAVLIR